MPTWFIIFVAVLFAIHTALNIGCFVWLWREYNPKRAFKDARRSTPVAPRPTGGWEVTRRDR